MFDSIIWLEWLEFAVRWVHAVTAIAWIGSSFYFIALDLGLRKVPESPPGTQGEEWQVHGGGFYHIQKYLVAPKRMPEHLIWFKWESYITWVSGFAMLVLVYYLGADLYLIDVSTSEMSTNVGILISVCSIGFGWIAYDLLCKSKLGNNSTALMVLLYVLLVAMAWGYTQVFTGRAAFLHLGAFTATIMSANVFFIIIPNQKIVVADLMAGKTPDAKYGKIAKLRSTHNNYLTLPVIFFMVSNHYPLAFATQYNWVIASLVFLMGVTVRHYFNSKHAGKGSPMWTWVATTLLFLAVMALSVAPMYWAGDGVEEDEAKAKATVQEQVLMATAGFDNVQEIVSSRCSMCHTSEPVWEGIAHPPKDVRLDTDVQIARRAKQIYIHSGVSNAMPPANVSYMEADERRAIVNWFKAAQSGS